MKSLLEGCANNESTSYNVLREMIRHEIINEELKDHAIGSIKESYLLGDNEEEVPHPI